MSLSMDGVYFLQNSVEIFVHQELVVQKQSPELLDLSATARVDHLELVSAILCILFYLLYLFIYLN